MGWDLCQYSRGDIHSGIILLIIWPMVLWGHGIKGSSHLRISILLSSDVHFQVPILVSSVVVTAKGLVYVTVASVLTALLLIATFHVVAESAGGFFLRCLPLWFRINFFAPHIWLPVHWLEGAGKQPSCQPVKTQIFRQQANWDKHTHCLSLRATQVTKGLGPLWLLAYSS